MIDVQQTSNGYSQAKFINVTAIVACASMLLVSPIVVKGNSNVSDGRNNGLVISTKNQMLDSDKEKDSLIRIINSEIGRTTKVSVKFDRDLDIYFFAIKTTDEDFDADYSSLQKIDIAMDGKSYLGKPIVVTLEE